VREKTWKFPIAQSDRRGHIGDVRQSLLAAVSLNGEKLSSFSTLVLQFTASGHYRASDGSSSNGGTL
jgi:hypothetical protein